MVTGGRLGPAEQHTLADVPNCYVRDRLMNSTSIDIDPEICDQVRKTVFSGLTPSQIKQYAATIEEMECQAGGRRPAETKEPRRSKEVSDRARIVREIQYSRKICPQEAECIMKQDELLDAIDDTINLAPNPSFTALKMKCLEFDPFLGTGSRRFSVLIPGTLVQKGAEIPMPRGYDIGKDCDIDRDCGQVRAMIKILVRRGHWTIEEFTLALEGPRRGQVSQFLEKRGPRQGKQSSVFPRSWDFFKRRELLGFELTAAPPQKLAREVRELLKLREVDPNRGHKRRGPENLERPRKLRKASNC